MNAEAKIKEIPAAVELIRPQYDFDFSDTYECEHCRGSGEDDDNGGELCTHCGASEQFDDVVEYLRRILFLFDWVREINASKPIDSYIHANLNLVVHNHLRVVNNPEIVPPGVAGVAHIAARH